MLTSEDGTIARYAAAELRTRRPVKVLAGGTAAWKAAGLPLETGMGPLASEPDDVALSARDRPADRERYMREYLAWEIELVNQIARDSRLPLPPRAGGVMPSPVSLRSTPSPALRGEGGPRRAAPGG